MTLAACFSELAGEDGGEWTVVGLTFGEEVKSRNTPVGSTAMPPVRRAPLLGYLEGALVDRNPADGQKDMCELVIVAVVHRLTLVFIRLPVEVRTGS